MFKIKAISIQVHDTSYGGYPYKAVVQLDIIDLEAFKKLKNDLGSLVLSVNNAVYAINNNIPAHNPSIDSQGSRNARNGVKHMEFVYHFKNHDKAEKLGLELVKLKNGEVFPKFSTYKSIEVK